MGFLTIEQWLLALGSLGAVLAQYITLVLAMTTIYSQMPACAYDWDAKQGEKKVEQDGWKKGRCLTSEQVWCRAHPGHHPNCPTADCRAEEIRIAYATSDPDVPASARDGSIKYHGCTNRALLDELQADIIVREAQLNLPLWDPAPVPCVPDGDVRSGLLGRCHPSIARCRGRFYIPHDRSPGFAPDIDCEVYWRYYQSPFSSEAQTALWNGTGLTLPVLY